MKQEPGKEANSFANILIDWYSREKRQLPWRDSGDPYHIWLSEIILQQTRVNQGLPYYHAFTEHFPTIHDLAAAEESLVLRVWQGLGYYSRARNLHRTAKIISRDLDGNFPNTYDQLLKLPGIGPYTAAAIASIAFSEARPTIDGNVYRVISRVFTVKQDIADAGARQVFLSLLEPLIDVEQPGDFNQALMELGATICTPKSPRCEVCPIVQSCSSRSLGEQSLYPVKSKKIKVRTRHFHYVVFEFEDKLGMRVRDKKDIWQGLYEFLLHEGPSFTPELLGPMTGVSSIEASQPIRHILTHQRIESVFYRITFAAEEKFLDALRKNELFPFSREQIVNLPKPKLVVNYLSTF